MYFTIKIYFEKGELQYKAVSAKVLPKDSFLVALRTSSTVRGHLLPLQTRPISSSLHFALSSEKLPKGYCFFLWLNFESGDSDKN